MGAETIVTFPSFLLLGNCQQQFSYSENYRESAFAHPNKQLIIFVNIIRSWKTFLSKSMFTLQYLGKNDHRYLIWTSEKAGIGLFGQHCLGAGRLFYTPSHFARPCYYCCYFCRHDGMPQIRLFYLLLTPLFVTPACIPR